jgi:DNA-directed RNA polymerase subunit RPC12/RpoP
VDNVGLHIALFVMSGDKRWNCGANMTHSLFTLIREGFYYCFHCDKIVELGDDTESPAKCPRCKKRTVEWQKPVELNETV